MNGHRQIHFQHWAPREKPHIPTEERSDEFSTPVSAVSHGEPEWLS